MAGLVSIALLASGCSSLTGGKWAAKVNGEAILVDDLNSRISAVQKEYEKQGMKFDTDQGKEALKQVKSEILEGMIGGKIVGQEVANLKLNVDDPKVVEQLNNLKKSIGDDAKFQDWLKQQAMTEPEVKSYLALSEKVTSDVKLTDAEIKAFFDKYIDQYGGQPEQVRARHILVKTEDEAKAIIAQLQPGAKGANVEAFAALAKEKSTEPAAKESGGDLGYFSKGKMVPDFEKAAFAQKVGTISQNPVKTEFGYHVILVEDHKQAVTPDFTKVKAEVEKDALGNAKGEKFEKYYNDLHQKAKIEYGTGFKPAK